MWRPNKQVEEDVLNFAGIPYSERRRSRRRAWRDGLADQTVVKGLEDVRSYRAFERTLISSVDPRTSIELELVHRLVSLLWRLHRATAIETGLFDIQSEFQLTPRQDASRQPGQRPPTPTRTSGHERVLATNEQDGPSVRDQEPLSTMSCARLSDGRSPVPSPNASCASPTLLPHCLTGWAATKRDSGAKPRKQSGHLTLSEGRRRL
jgi:hypothetical protein